MGKRPLSRIDYARSWLAIKKYLITFELWKIAFRMEIVVSHRCEKELLLGFYQQNVRFGLKKRIGRVKYPERLMFITRGSNEIISDLFFFYFFFLKETAPLRRTDQAKNGTNRCKCVWIQQINIFIRIHSYSPLLFGIVTNGPKQHENNNTKKCSANAVPKCLCMFSRMRIVLRPKIPTAFWRKLMSLRWHFDHCAQTCNF